MLCSLLKTKFIEKIRKFQWAPYTAEFSTIDAKERLGNINTLEHR